MRHRVPCTAGLEQAVTNNRYGSQPPDFIPQGQPANFGVCLSRNASNASNGSAGGDEDVIGR